MPHSFARLICTISAAFCLTVALAPRSHAQRRSAASPELKGSKASVEKMYDFARVNRMPFYLTPTNVDRAIAEGRLVALTGDSTYELTRGVGYSYSTREAKAFVLAFAPQYLAACGVPLTVTSAARPMSRQPHNANPHSVHPTGIAVDIRRPPGGPCQTWLRGALTELEHRGIVEATEERHPVHLHVAVIVRPGAKVLLPNLVQTVVARQVTTPAVVAANATTSNVDVAVTGKPPVQRTYTVRQGDTLWDIANRTGVSMTALTKANSGAAHGALKPGKTLVLPAGN